MDSKTIRGTWEDAYSPVVEKLQDQIDAGRHLGGALAVWSEGLPVVDVVFGDRNTEGDPWEDDTIAVTFSTTKGMASLALHMLADSGEIDYEAPVTRYWPQFGRNGKDAITVRHILTHEAGLHRIRDYVTDPTAITDWDRMIELIESMEPAYEPGTANGYHATSFGWLVGELIRRVSGSDISTFVIEEIARPLGLDGFYIGMPKSETGRLARLTMDTAETSAIPPVLSPTAREGAGAASERSEGGSPQSVMEEGLRALAPGFERVVANDVDILTVPLPAGNGVFTARSLAEAYSAMLYTPEGRQAPMISGEALEKISAVYNSRPDVVIGLPMMWRLGYHSIFTASGVLPRAIGHFGFGGSGAFVDIDSGIAAALVVNKISLSFTGVLRFVELADAAVRCARR